MNNRDLAERALRLAITYWFNEPKRERALKLYAEFVTRDTVRYILWGSTDPSSVTRITGIMPRDVMPVSTQGPKHWTQLNKTWRGSKVR